MKHTPATPLPLHVYVEQPNDGFTGDKQKVRIYNPENEHVASVLRHDNLPRAKLRAAYIVHAANAYPGAVVAIKSALCFLEGLSKDPQHIVAMRLRSVLRELGEDQ